SRGTGGIPGAPPRHASVAVIRRPLRERYCRHRRAPRGTAVQRPHTARPAAPAAQEKPDAQTRLPQTRLPQTALMPLLVDSGVLYALADRSDAWHDRVSAYLESSRATLLAPIMVLPEVVYLLRQRLGIPAEQAFIESVSRGEIAVEDVKRRDWA